MSNFRIKNKKLYDGDNLVQLEMGNLEQMQFVKNINKRAEELKDGIFATEGMKFECVCLAQIKIPSHCEVGSNFHCDYCRTEYIIQKPRNHHYLPTLKTI